MNPSDVRTTIEVTSKNMQSIGVSEQVQNEILVNGNRKRIQHAKGQWFVNFKVIAYK